MKDGKDGIKDVAVLPFSRLDQGQNVSKHGAAVQIAESSGDLLTVIGIETHTALALITEVSDFKRFRKADQFAAYLGLIPGEHSSSNNTNRLAGR